MEGSIFKMGVWENYKFIARTFGFTIPGLKKIFVEEKLLAGNKPTDDVIAAKIAVIESIDSIYGSPERILWSVPAISEIMKKRGIGELVGEEKLLHIENFHQLTSRIHELGERMMGILEFQYQEPAPKWLRKKASDDFDVEQKFGEAMGGLMESMFESYRYLNLTSKSEFVEYLKGDFDSAFELAKLYSRKKSDEIKFCKKLYQSILDWVTDKKIQTHILNPYK